MTGFFELKIRAFSGGTTKVKIDPEDQELVEQYTWHENDQGYAVTTKMRDGKIYRYRMHRLIMGLGRGRNKQRRDTQQIDHINRDRLDNRKDNLRIVTLSENRKNSRARGGSSQYRGVSWDKNAGKWGARVGYNGQQHYIGLFTDELVAAKAIEEKRVELMGQIAGGGLY